MEATALNPNGLAQLARPKAPKAAKLPTLKGKSSTRRSCVAGQQAGEAAVPVAQCDLTNTQCVVANDEAGQSRARQRRRSVARPAPIDSRAQQDKRKGASSSRPPRASVREVRSWEQKTGKLYSELSAADRIAVDKDIARARAGAQ